MRTRATSLKNFSPCHAMWQGRERSGRIHTIDAKTWRYVQKRHKHKCAPEHARMRQDASGVLRYHGVKQEQVQVDGPRPETQGRAVGPCGAHAPERGLDAEQGFQQLHRMPRTPKSQAQYLIQKPGLLGIVLRLRGIDGRPGRDVYAGQCCNRIAGARKHGLCLPAVGTKADERCDRGVVHDFSVRANDTRPPRDIRGQPDCHSGATIRRSGFR